MILKAILLAFLVAAATSLDEIPLLFLLYAKKDGRSKGLAVTGGYFLGSAILIGLAILASLGVGLIPDRRLVGLLGLVPLVMGILALVKKEDGEETERAMPSSRKFGALALQTAAITLGLGFDDLGGYIPLFSAYSGWEIVPMVLALFLCAALICLLSRILTQIGRLSRWIEKYERFITGAVFIVLGIVILYECGTLRFV